MDWKSRVVERIELDLRKIIVFKLFSSIVCGFCGFFAPHNNSDITSL